MTRQGKEISNFINHSWFRTLLVDLESNETVATLPLKRTMAMAFSPRDTYFMLWEPYATYAGEVCCYSRLNNFVIDLLLTAQDAKFFF